MYFNILGIFIYVTTVLTGILTIYEFTVSSLNLSSWGTYLKAVCGTCDQRMLTSRNFICASPNLSDLSPTSEILAVLRVPIKMCVVVCIGGVNRTCTSAKCVQAFILLLHFYFTYAKKWRLRDVRSSESGNPRLLQFHAPSNHPVTMLSMCS